MRKIAREAVIFMLLGPVVTGIAAFIYLKRQNAGDIKVEAARGVYAIDAAQEPVGFTPDNSVLVPLTNGVQLYVTDCAQVHLRQLTVPSPQPILMKSRLLQSVICCCLPRG